LLLTFVYDRVQRKEEKQQQRGSCEIPEEKKKKQLTGKSVLIGGHDGSAGIGQG
jgi:FlaA1/EpsC-like NDP-sugar epimerase